MEQDFNKLKEIMDAIPEINFICLDVANGYTESFVQFVRTVRKTYPTKTIIVSNSIQIEYKLFYLKRMEVKCFILFKAGNVVTGMYQCSYLKILIQFFFFDLR